MIMFKLWTLSATRLYRKIFWATYSIAWENSWHFMTPSLVSTQNDVRETSAEILYWQLVTTQIWVVSSQQYGIYVLVSLTSFCGKPVLVSWNVSCFHRLNSILILNMSRNYIMIKCTQLKKMGYCGNYSIRTPLAGHLLNFH